MPSPKEYLIKVPSDKDKDVTVTDLFQTKINEGDPFESSKCVDNGEASFSTRPPLPAPYHSPTAAFPPPSSNFLKKNSIEYMFHFTVTAVGIFGTCCYNLLLISNKYRELLRYYLRRPWIPYRWLGSHGVDVADGQWRNLATALPFILPTFFLFLFISHRVRRYSQRVSTPHTSTVAVDTNTTAMFDTNESSAADSLRQPLSTDSDVSTPVVQAELNPVYLNLLHVFFGFTCSFILSGFGCIFGLVLIIFNYYLIAMLYKRFSFMVCTTIMWISHVAILFLNFHAGGYRFAWFGLGVLDRLWDPLFNWNIQYNMSVLRMIAFNNDLWEATGNTEERSRQIRLKHKKVCLECAIIRDENRDILFNPRSEALQCYKSRTDCSRPLLEYNLVSYLGYIFYPPLFVAGPMMSFNAYMSYLRQQSHRVSRKAKGLYGLRCFLSFVLLVTLMHYIHITGMVFNRFASEPRSVLEMLNYTQKGFLFFIYLYFLWCKFDFIWKFFRFIALLDGIEPPEDMRRFFSNTVNIQGFWRDWHASFNQWVVRYMYIPMGGRKYKFLSIFPIFFFIAIWHDIELRLFFWAGIICLFFIPETILTSIFFSNKYQLIVRLRQREVLWRVLRTLGADFSLLLLLAINIIGFSVGETQAKREINEILQDFGWRFCVVVFLAFYSLASIAIQDRDQEAYEEYLLRLKYNLLPR